MKKIELARLEKYIDSALIASGLNDLYAGQMTEVFMRATLRGVGHHDIYSFASRLKDLRDGKISSYPDIRLIRSFGSIECYDGDNGPGEVCSTYIMERAIKIADKFGIALCTIINSNHFLAAAPYVEMAAEKGYVAVLYTRGGPGMGAPGRTEQVISACLMGFAAPTDKGYPIMMDMCMAYASGGLLDAKIKANEKVPPHWGTDKNGNPTTDPAAIANGGTRLPIGSHKGFGLAILGELFTGVLSGGQVIDEPNPRTGKVGTASQAIITVKVDGLMTIGEFKAKTGEMIDRLEARAPNVHIPGQGSYKNRDRMIAQKVIELSDELVEELNHWSIDLTIDSLT